MALCFFFSSRRRHTRYIGDWSSDVCSSDLGYNSSNTTHLAAICQASAPTYHIEDATCMDPETGGIRFQPEIGRASCRERVLISVVAVRFQHKKNKMCQTINTKVDLIYS